MRFCDLTEKEVINVCDCKCREFELFIPWCKIVRIGPDIILVDIDEKEAKHKV